MKIYCSLKDPVELDTHEWEYSKFECDFDNLFEVIENPTTSANFVLQKTFTYGDFFVMGFLTLIILVGGVKIIWQTFVKD